MMIQWSSYLKSPYASYDDTMIKLGILFASCGDTMSK